MNGDTTVAGFIEALGVEIRRVPPDGTCATYDRFNRVAYVCGCMCKDEQRALESLLARIA